MAQLDLGGAAGAATLQEAYDASSVPQIVVASGQAVTIRDDAGNPNVTDLLRVETAAGGNLFKVSPSAYDGIEVGADVKSRTDDYWAVGTASNRFAEVRAGRVVAMRGGGNATFTDGYNNQGGIIAGLTDAYADLELGAATGYAGAAVMGKAIANVGTNNARLSCFGGGSVVFGSALARASLSAQTAYIETSEYCYGGLAGGYVFAGGLGGKTARILNESAGAFCWGYIAGAANATGTHTIGASAGSLGAFVVGNISTSGGSGNKTIRAYSSRGAFVQGYARGNGTATIEAYNANGGFAQGQVNNTGTIRSSNNGAFAQGFATGGSSAYIESSGNGSFAQGRAAGSGYILASANGAFAQGNTTAGNPIVASATNAAQFGPGTNSLADSLSVGGGPRLKGTTGAPGTPRDGDIWVDNNYVYIRSNGVSVQIT